MGASASPGFTALEDVTVTHEQLKNALGERVEIPAPFAGAARRLAGSRRQHGAAARAS